MGRDFELPSGLIGRFAVVKLWPELKTAEDECVARLKRAASDLGLECIEIHSDGRVLDAPARRITGRDVDFVLHLHYDTPKAYDAFSFVALWNPIHFYHEWGYSRSSRNLLTHDDFISCSSRVADDHVGRLVRRSRTHLPPLFHLYHSVSDIVHSPSLGDRKLFYAGMNWERLGDGKSRHQELLKRLDRTGALRIYGPLRFQGVRVWKGYESFVGEIPFDGISMINEISRAGIALVLSSPAHRESELMSSRLFESVAAGALVISDENPFSHRHFGDALLYVDTRSSTEDCCRTILDHLAWADANGDEALKMAAKAQEIFRQRFTHKRNLADLYRGLPNRKRALRAHQRATGGSGLTVRLNLLLPEFSEADLEAHLGSAVAQDYEFASAVLVVDKLAADKNRSRIEAALEKLPVPIDLLEIDFFKVGPGREIKTRRNLGEVLGEILVRCSGTDAVIFVSPNERIFSNHVRVLAESLRRDPTRNCAATSVILKKGDETIRSVHDRIDFRCLNSALPNGYARFVFRVSAISDDLGLALPYLDRKALAILAGDDPIATEIPSTVIIDVAREFPTGPWDEGKENAVICDMYPASFSLNTGHEIILPHLPLRPQTVSGLIRSLPVRLRWSWIVAQIQVLRRQGLVARLRALRRKLKGNPV